MKTILTPSYIFTPAAKQIKTNISSFDINRLYAIINQTNGLIIYSTASTTAGYTSYNSTTDILTLQFDTTAQASSNELQFIYDDPSLDYALQDTAANTEAINNILTSFRSSTGFLRVVTDSASIVNQVNTISTVNSLSQIGGIQAVTVVPSISNQLAIQSNINNIKIT
mgnify:CR=1 FL=1|tara:strand:- start:2424 stop:2927 length:504 start_codon:yes stop_codon:yes gene_type:complete